MPLTLTVASFKGAPPPNPASISIEHESISIGRQPGNSLILSDPESIVSSKHAEIEYRNDGYYITDTSTNHTLIGHTDRQVSNGQLLKKGQSAKLNNNDLLTIGDYVIQVSITSQQSHAAPDDQGFTDNFDDSESLFETEDILDSGSDDSFADIVSPAAQSEDLLGQEAQDHQANDDFSFLDSIIDADEMSPDKGMPTSDASDPFADIEPAREGGDKLAQAKAPADDTADEFSFLDSFGKSGQLADVNKIAGTDSDDPFADIGSASGDREQPSKKTGAAAAAPPMPPQEPASASGTAADPEHIANFLKGAGITNNSIAGRIDANSFYLIGQLLSRSLQGAIQVLWARSKIKSELGMEVTVIHGRGNNPLKFSPSAQESLVKMLDPQGEAYMPAIDAIDEAFRDIGAHEMAVMAGMRSALTDVLKRFDPEYLEQRLQKKSPTGVKIPGYKQAMLWDLYRDLYTEIEKEAQDNFSRLFGRAFTKAYNDQLRKSKDNR